jgi:uncharacterized surface protein with fasciclin (FAS1) repeats
MMKMSGNVWGLKLVLCASLLSVGSVNAVHAGNCGSHAKAAGHQANLVDTAVAAGNFKTLIKAAQVAGLADTLRQADALTVFAPTDDAFARLPEGAIEDLLKSPDRLKAVLLQHVVPGRLMAADVLGRKSLKTALGQTVNVGHSSAAMIGNARITATDIEASNGVIHVIDAVILPQNDLIEAARGAGSFTTLLAALEAAGLTDALRGDGPFTVFAPTDDAFAKLPEGALKGLLADEQKLKAILTYHVVPGRVTSADVINLSEAKTLQGSKIAIETSQGVRVNDARVVKVDVPATNGVIHVIDSVIVPSSS